MLKRLFKLTALKLALVIGVVFAAGHFVWRVKSTQTDVKVFKLLETWEASALDAKFRLRGTVDSSHRVTIAGVDEASVQRYGLWPWRRDLVGRALKNLNDAGALAIGVDMWFSDPDRNSSHVAVNKLIDDALARLPPGEADSTEGQKLAPLRSLLDGARAADPDLLFAEALKASPRVVLGASGFPRAEDAAVVPAAALARDEAELARFSLDKVYGMVQTVSGTTSVLDWDTLRTPLVSELTGVRSIVGVQLSLPVITRATAHLGLIDSTPDSDGRVRHYPLFTRLHDHLIPSLALETAAVARDAQPVALISQSVGSDIGTVGLMAGDRKTGMRLEIEVEPAQALYLVNYPGKFDATVGGKPIYERIALADAVDNTFEPAKVKGHVVLVGATATGTFDQRVTPFDDIVPGVYTHAAVIDNILTGNQLAQTAGLALVEVAMLLLLALAFGLIIPRFDAYYWQLLFMALVGGGYVALDFALFCRGVALATIMPLSEMALLFVSLIVFKLVITDREKRQVRTAFQHYLAPSVLEDMVKNPDKLKLGGEKRELTVFFSDIRGFTTISERLPADELARLLNEYLTPMSNLVFKHQGTLDKYMGDAIMAFWGAPMEQPDHAFRACVAAVEMLAELDRLRAQWRAQGRPEIHIGIGLNSGPMSVGNMGSNMFFNYTVMGDNVNLGSRLEGTNKAYGTKIIISEFTFAKVKGQVVSRELGSVRVKGKKLPVGIYELRGIGQPAPADAAVIADFEAAIAAYRQKKWAESEALFQKVLAVWKEDGPSTHYLEDIEDKKKSPPPEGWDGVYEMKTK